jgi:predicted membrane channel-forming protein YqfA (hemolysin III family)
MWLIAIAAADRSGGHPLWHLLVIAGGAIGLFAVIKMREHRHARR